MGRRKTSLVEDIFDALQELPWYVGVVAAGLFWLVGMAVAARAGSTSMTAGIRPILKFMFNGLALLSLVAAAVSAAKSGSRRRLLDQQRGIEGLRSLSWQQFEQLVGEAYRRRGYAIEETGGGGADGGIDLALRGGGERILVQCKRWRTRRVGVDKVRELYGVIMAENATSGILVTSGHFTMDAQSFAAGKPITLIDGAALAELVRDVQAGLVSNAGPGTELKEADTPVCPKCGERMVLRTAKRGINAGSRFYGCPLYPQCRGTRPA